jgi:hypothetical protein
MNGLNNRKLTGRSDFALIINVDQRPLRIISHRKDFQISSINERREGPYILCHFQKFAWLLDEKRGGMYIHAFSTWIIQK